MAFTASTWGQGRLLTGLSPSSSLSGFTAVITKANLPASALDTGSLSCLNGGGDWRFSTDINGATQLPCEIYTCVTNASAGNTEFVAWIRFPAYASGTRSVYAFWNKAGQSQPAAGATFGSEAVWTDYTVVSHDTFTESTGNPTVTPGGSVSSAVGIFGNAGGAGTNNSGDSVVYTGISMPAQWTLQAWVIADEVNGRFVSLGQIGSTSNQANLQTSSSGVVEYLRNGNDPTTSTIFRNQTSYSFFAARESSALGNLIWVDDGTLSQNITYNSSFPTLDRAAIFVSADDSPFGRNPQTLCEIRISPLALPDVHLESEYANQDNPSTFWTGGAVFVPGGGGITITGATPNYNYAAIAGTIDLTGTITVTGDTPNYSYTAISGAVELTSQIIITGATPNFSYAAIPGAVSLTSQITITGATPNYSYAAITGLVDLTPQITITGATPNYSYNAISGTVEFLGTITVTGDTPNYSYSAIRATIQVGERIYLNNFVGEQAQQGVFNGIVKSSNFSGIIKQPASFNGITSNTPTFIGIAK